MKYSFVVLLSFVLPVLFVQSGCSRLKHSAVGPKESLVIAPQVSVVELRGWFMGFKNTLGSFDELSGRLEFDHKEIEKSRLNVSVQTASIDCPHSLIADDVKGKDFLDINKYKQIQFTSTKIKTTDDPTSLEVNGELTMRGVTLPVSFVLRKTMMKHKGSMDGIWQTRFMILRSDYGMVKSRRLFSDKIEVRAIFKALKL